MIIDLPLAVQQHLKRVTDLAEEAATDTEQGYQSRSSAMSAVTTMLKELTKTQESLVNMERLQKTERVIVETVTEYLAAEQLDHIIKLLDERLAAIE